MSTDDAGNAPVVVVTGLPRSGTSLMMHMLRAGGLDVVADYPDAEDGESGLESSLVEGLPEDTDWLGDAAGKAVKILDPHRWRPPEGPRYCFLWMSRGVKAQAKSQRKMLQAAGQQVSRSKLSRFRELIKRDTKRARRLRDYPGSEFHVVRFERLLRKPERHAGRVAGIVETLLPVVLDDDAMAAQVSRRGDDSLPYMKETRPVSL